MFKQTRVQCQYGTSSIPGISSCHSGPNYPCKKECYCCHKGMDIGISYVVIHVCVYKKFFQVLLQRSSVHHLVVLSESLPHRQSCQSILECCLDLGHCQRDRRDLWSTARCDGYCTSRCSAHWIERGMLHAGYMVYARSFL